MNDSSFIIIGPFQTINASAKNILQKAEVEKSALKSCAAFGLICDCADLLCSSDVELPQLSLQVRVDLQVKQGLADALLDLVRLLIVHLDDLTPGYASHGDF